MRRVKITTPENIDIEYRLAGLGARGAAAVIDLLIQTFAILIIIITIAAFQVNLNDLMEEYEGWVIGGVILLVWIITYGYFIIFEMAMNGRTPGKKLFNLRTIRDNGQPITIKHSIIRNLFRIIIDTYGIGIILMFFSNQYKRVGDYVASTMVIVEEKRVAPKALEIDLNKHDYKYSITEDEQRLLIDYLQRKNDLEKGSEKLEKELGEYFSKKLEVSIDEKEYGSFLNEVLEQSAVQK